MMKRDFGMEMMSRWHGLECTTLTMDPSLCTVLPDCEQCVLHEWFTVMSTSMLVGKLVGKWVRRHGVRASSLELLASSSLWTLFLSLPLIFMETSQLREQICPSRASSDCTPTGLGGLWAGGSRSCREWERLDGGGWLWQPGKASRALSAGQSSFVAGGWHDEGLAGRGGAGTASTLEDLSDPVLCNTPAFTLVLRSSSAWETRGFEPPAAVLDGVGARSVGPGGWACVPECLAALSRPCCCELCSFPASYSASRS